MGFKVVGEWPKLLKLCNNPMNVNRMGNQQPGIPPSFWAVSYLLPGGICAYQDQCKDPYLRMLAPDALV